VEKNFRRFKFELWRRSNHFGLWENRVADSWAEGKQVNIHALFILFKINNTKCSLRRSLISTVCLRNVDDAVWIIDKRKKNGFKSNSLDLPVLCSLIDMNLYRNYIDIKIIKTVVFLLGDFWFQIMEKWYNVYILSFDQMSQLLEHARTTLI